MMHDDSGCGTNKIKIAKAHQNSIPFITGEDDILAIPADFTSTDDVKKLHSMKIILW